MQQRNYIFLLLLIPAILCSGCKKWLDKKQNTSIAFPQTLTDLQALLDAPKTINEFVTPSMPEAAADNYFIQQADYNNQAGILSRVAPYTWARDPYNFPNNDWRVSYNIVNVANVCLQQLKTISRTELTADQWDRIKGTAHFIRAYYFLELCWIYAKAYDSATAANDLGIALRLAADVNEHSVRASVQQSYQQVIEDAREALAFLPDKLFHSLRPSKAAGYGLLARIFLSMRQYDSTLKYANLALQANDLLMNYNGDPYINNNISVAAFPFRKYNKEVVFYTSMNRIHTTCLPTIGARIDTLLYANYDNNDLRKTRFFFIGTGGYPVFKGSYAAETDNLFTGIATDELLLTRAECLARVGGVTKTGDKDAALSDLNKLLATRWKEGTFQPITTATAADALTIILRERRKELLMRGLRWMDIKRLNKEDAGIIITRKINGQVYELLPNDNRYAQPLPQDVIDLTGMPQNP